MTRRRTFLALPLWLALGAPRAWAQSGRVARLGILATTPTAEDIARSSFLLKLKELGWEEGRNLKIERRFAPTPPELEKAARELAALKLDVVYAPGATAIHAAKKEIASIPIVIFSVGDPVRSGWLTNLARPEGNLTGVAGFSRDLNGKRISLLKEAVPTLKRIAVLGNPANANLPALFRDLAERARAAGIEARLYEVRDPSAFEPAFAAMARDKMNGLMEVPDPMIYARSKEVGELAARHRLPAIFEPRKHAESGSVMMAYGADYDELSRRAAAYIDRLLRGAKPAELPIEFPAKFELLVNLRAARALRLTLPQSLLVRADGVIE